MLFFCNGGPLLESVHDTRIESVSPVAPGGTLAAVVA
jgi:hypothetical protein